MMVPVGNKHSLYHDKFAVDDWLCVFYFSGEPGAQRLHKTADDADINAHAGPEGCHRGCPLWKFPSAVYLADITTRS